MKPSRKYRSWSNSIVWAIFFNYHNCRKLFRIYFLWTKQLWQVDWISKPPTFPFTRAKPIRTALITGKTRDVSLIRLLVDRPLRRGLEKNKWEITPTIIILSISIFVQRDKGARRGSNGEFCVYWVKCKNPGSSADSSYIILIDLLSNAKVITLNHLWIAL